MGSPSQSYGASPAICDHRSQCYLMQVNMLHFNPSQILLVSRVSLLVIRTWTYPHFSISWDQPHYTPKVSEQSGKIFSCKLYIWC